jgi:S-adenosylmethionine/arginine decarboxylase-like enzyme
MISQGDKKNGHIKKSDAAAAVQKQQAKQPPAQSLESSSSSGFGCPSSSVRLSGLFMLLILLISVSVSFTLGRYCQSYHFPSFQQHALKEKSIAALLFVAPPPKKSQFLSRDNNSDTKNIKQHDDDDTEENDKERDHNNVSSGAEHLLIDVTHVDPAFLSSPTRLETSLLTLLHENLNDQMLSFRHTNRLEVGGGISFTVLLLQSHVFLHAWPSIGVLTLDIYKSKSLTASAEDNNRQEEVEEESIINLVPVIENLFAMGDRDKLDDDNDKQPHFFWSIKDRAVDYESDKSDHPADSADYRTHYLGRRAFTHKQQVSVVETPFQTFEVYDVIDIRDAHQKADRILFLDHVTQSSRRGLEPYHEALVHPALLAHPNPKRVAIVGGGEGATLREVLIHSTVETVVMIEIDAVMVNASKTALLEWNDCSDLVGSTASCFDDPRAEVYLEDAVGWFLDRYYKRNVPEEEKFDVIIMDAL